MTMLMVVTMMMAVTMNDAGDISNDMKLLRTMIMRME